MSVNPLPPALDAELRSAIRGHEAGRRDEAEAMYRRVLALHPDNSLAKQMLGVLSHELGRAADADRLLREAIALKPDFADAHVNLGVALAQVGRFEEAIACYRRGLALGFDSAVGQFNMGVSLMHAGRLQEASEAFRKATSATGGRRQSSFVNLGNVLLRMGNVVEAEIALRVAVDLKPSDGGALALLAQALERLGRLEEAEKTYAKSLDILPDETDIAFKHAALLLSLNRGEEAKEAFRAIIRRNPRHVTATLNLAQVMVNDGEKDEALAMLQQLILLVPDNTDARNAIGATHYMRGENEAAVPHFRRAIELSPANGYAHYHLGIALEALGRRAEAFEAIRGALACDDQHAEAHAVAGRLMHMLGNPAGALDACNRAVALKPRMADAHLYIVNLLREIGRADAAIEAARDLVALAPDLVNARLSLALALDSASRFDEAQTELEGVLETVSPSAAYNALGGIKKSKWKMAEAREAYRKAMEAEDATPGVGSNYLLMLNYAEDLSAEEVLAGHRAWGDRWQKDVEPMPPRAPDQADDIPGRKLRIGYLSPDFRNHVVMHFLQPLLSRHDLQRHDITLYGEVAYEDNITARIKSYGYRYVRTVGMPDKELAERIAKDRIDILIDLAGHTGNNRLLVMAHRPAPIQGSYLGYPNTTGMSRCDIRIADAITDPPGTGDALTVERVVRLPGSFLCYQIPADIPDVNELPARKAGVVTFGSFNKLAKVTPGMLDVWARVLHRVPESRMFVKGWSMADTAARDHLRDEFLKRGIAADRIVPRPFIMDAHFLSGFHEVDIALDTNPYSGTTTTFDALSMGVPVITLLGDRHSARVGASVLTTLGHADWVADDEDSYVNIAADLAGDLDRLAAIRAGLRSALAASPLCDAVGFATKFETMLAEVWASRPRLDPVPVPIEDTNGATESDGVVTAEPMPPIMVEPIAGRLWYHAVPLPDGSTTPGWAPLLPEVVGLPESLTGQSVLDVDARDGYWSFEAMRRGATAVTALHLPPDGSAADIYRSDAAANFALARELLALDPLRCASVEGDVEDERLSAAGPFDLVLVQDFQMDWRDPLKRLRSLAALCRGTILLEAAVSDLVDDPDAPPALTMEGGAALPNLAWLGTLVESAGFDDVQGWLLQEVATHPLARRGIIRARRP